MADRATRPFWMHQLVEYVLGVALIMMAVQDPSPAIPGLAGVLILVNASLVHGPLGAFKLVSRRQHRTLDLVVIAVILFASLQPWVSVSASGRITMLFMLIPLGFLWWYTDFANRSERKQRQAAAAGPRGEKVGRQAGRVAGATYNAARREVRKRTAPKD